MLGNVVHSRELYDVVVSCTGVWRRLVQHSMVQSIAAQSNKSWSSKCVVVQSGLV